jgi:hypothetical protein
VGEKSTIKNVGVPYGGESMSFVAEFEFEKSTKNTHRFTEVDNGEAPKIGTLYVKKYCFTESVPPKKIKVTVEVL